MQCTVCKLLSEKISAGFKKKSDSFTSNFQAQENKTKIKIIYPPFFLFIFKKRLCGKVFFVEHSLKILKMWRLTSPNLRFFRHFVRKIEQLKFFPSKAFSSLKFCHCSQLEIKFEKVLACFYFLISVLLPEFF